MFLESRGQAPCELQTRAALSTSVYENLCFYMPSSDISVAVPMRSSRELSLKVSDTLRASSVVVVLAMIWAAPLSSILAINLFRVSVILWLLQAWNSRQPRAYSRVFIPLLCFLAVSSIASLAARDRVTSWQEMKPVELGLAAVVIADFIRSMRQLTFMIAGVLATSCVAALIAIWQIGSAAILRAQGLYKHYINFGEMMLLVAMLSFGVLLASLRCARVRWKIAAAVVFLLLSAGLAATATRTFLAALLFGCAVMVWLQFRWKVRLIAAAALVLAIVIGGLWLHSRRGMTWFDSSDPGTQYRFLIWKDGARIIQAHPLLGVGFANVQRHPDRFNMAAYRAFPNMISHFHSTPIEIAADCGIPALLVWCWLMYSCWATAKRALNNARATWLGHGTALGALGAITAFQFASLFHYILGDPEPMLIFWSLIAAAIILGSTGQQSAEALVPIHSR
jgi:O-antigen ligase